MAFVLKGVISWQSGLWSGSWTSGDATVESPFSYDLQSMPAGSFLDVLAAGEKRKFPVISAWKGTFSFTAAPGKPAKAIPDHFTLELRPPDYDGAAIRAEGSGRNPVGQYTLVGALDAASGVLEVERRYGGADGKATKTPKRRVPKPPRTAAAEAAAPGDAPYAGDAAAVARRSSGRPVKRRRRSLSEDGSGGGLVGEGDDVSGGEGGPPPAPTASRAVAGAAGSSAASSLHEYPAAGRLASPGAALASGRASSRAAAAASLPAGRGGKKPQSRSSAWVAAAVLGREAGAAAGELYEGEMLGGAPHGAGTCVYRNGLMYEGQWVAGRETGLGVISGSDDVVLFQGEVADGLPHGSGEGSRLM